MRLDSDSLFARVLRYLAEAVCRHPAWFIYPQIALAVVCGVYTAFRLKLDMNRDHLIGPHLKGHRVYLQFVKDFPDQDQLAVVVESARAERDRQFVERLAAKVKPQTNLFADVFYKADPTTLGPKGLLLASTNDLREMKAALAEYLPTIREFGQATNLNSLFELVNRQFRAAAPEQNQQTAALLGSLPMLQNIVSQATESMLRLGRPPPPGVDTLLSGGTEAQSQIYITLDHGRLYLLTVRPRSEAATPEAIIAMRQAIAQTRLEVPGVDAGLTGGPVLDYDEMKQADHDSIQASIAALVLCSLIFIIAYRQITRPLKAALCLLIGLAYTMGFTTLVIGSLNILTVTFAPMLIGLAIDFGIHYITRYEEEVRNRRTPEEAVFKSTVFTGQGIVTGGLTTAAAFLAMALTHFKGIREMGIIAGGGLLLCLVPMMTTLPALLVGGRQNQIDYQLGPRGQRRVRLENLWLQRPVLVIALTLLLCAFCAWAFGKIYFDYDLLHMQSQRLSSVIYEKKLIHSGRHSMFAAVIADSPQQALEYQHRIRQLPSVSTVESVAQYVTGRQTRKLELVRSVKQELQSLHFKPVDLRPIRLHQLSATLWYLTGYLGLAADQARAEEPALARELESLRNSIVQLRKVMLSGRPGAAHQLYLFQEAFFRDLQQTFNALKHQDTSGPLRPQDLAPALRNQFIGINGKKLLLQVYPKEDIWKHENQKEFIDHLESVVPPDRVTGDPVELYIYTTLLKNSYQHAAAYAVIAIAVMVFLHFRSLLSVFLCLLPVAIGWCWLLGLMGTAGIPFNPANVMILPLVVGIGVTNGIQVMNRFAEEQNARILAKSTGKAVLVSGLTATTGFATLMLARHQGIKSLGEVMSVGILACMVAGLTFLPAVLALLGRKGWTVPMRVGRRPATA